METYAQILLIAMPIFLIFVMAEQIYGYYARKTPFHHLDTISSLSSGFTNSLKDVLGLSVSIITYSWLVKHVAIFEIKSSVWIAIIAFIALDFAGYWTHRISHEINFFWNRHVIHHSSEEFNLACALRQSISVFVNIFTVFLIPAAIFGVPAEIIAIIAPLHLFAQFWYHTMYINRMGFLEKIIVTPSHHRVHHAVNPIYLDKNHGQIFIIWDKFFGTFQEELDSEPPIFGITRPALTWNPFKINFQHLWLLIKDSFRTNNWKDKFRIWWMPTGWRPEDVAEKYPVYKMENIYTYQKYDSRASSTLVVWSWIQFLFSFFLICMLYLNIAALTPTHLLIFGFFIFLSIYAYSELMDKSPWAMAWEIARNVLGITLVIQTDWFGLTQTQPWLGWVLLSYFILATVVVGYFVREIVMEENTISHKKATAY